MMWAGWLTPIPFVFSRQLHCCLLSLSLSLPFIFTMYLRLCALFEFVCISNPSEWNGPCSRRVPSSARPFFLCSVCGPWVRSGCGIDLNCFPAEALVFQVFLFPFRSFLFLSSFLFRFLFSFSFSFFVVVKIPSPMRSTASEKC
jgi:hypothetical protein